MDNVSEAVRSAFGCDNFQGPGAVTKRRGEVRLWLLAEVQLPSE